MEEMGRGSDQQWSPQSMSRSGSPNAPIHRWSRWSSGQLHWSRRCGGSSRPHLALLRLGFYSSIARFFRSLSCSRLVPGLSISSAGTRRRHRGRKRRWRARPYCLLRRHCPLRCIFAHPTAIVASSGCRLLHFIACYSGPVCIHHSFLRRATSAWMHDWSGAAATITET